MKAAFDWERHKIIAKRTPFCFSFFVFLSGSEPFLFKTEN